MPSPGTPQRSAGARLISAPSPSWRANAMIAVAVLATIAVLPLITTNTDQNVQVISDGITDSLIDSLSKLPNLRVMSRSSVFHHKGREIDSQAVGRELKVKAVLTGRLVQERDNLVLNNKLVNVADDRHLWGEEYERKVS